MAPRKSTKKRKAARSRKGARKHLQKESAENKENQDVNLKKTQTKEVPEEKKHKEPNPEGAVDIPEFLGGTPGEEYESSPREEQLWSPETDVEKWFPEYTFLGRGLLTLRQQLLGISLEDGELKSSRTDGDQYLGDTLHRCNYEPVKAITAIGTLELPATITTHWATEEKELFKQGFSKHGKMFSLVSQHFLPAKTTKQIIQYYYSWKRSQEGLEFRRKIIRRRPKKPTRRSGGTAKVNTNEILTRSKTQRSTV